MAIDGEEPIMEFYRQLLPEGDVLDIRNAVLIGQRLSEYLMDEKSTPPELREAWERLRQFMKTRKSPADEFMTIRGDSWIKPKDDEAFRLFGDDLYSAQ